MEELKANTISGTEGNCGSVPTHYLIENEQVRYWCKEHDLKHAKEDFKTKPIFGIEDVEHKVKVVLDQISNIKHSRFAQDSQINQEKMNKWVQKIESSLEVGREVIKSFDKKDEVKYLRLCEKIMDDGRSFLHHPLYFKYLRDKELDPSIEENPESIKGLRKTIELLTKENIELKEELKSSLTGFKQDKLLEGFGSSKILTNKIVEFLDVTFKNCRFETPEEAGIALENDISSFLNYNEEAKFENLEDAKEFVDDEVLKVCTKYNLRIDQSLLPSQVIDISNDFGRHLANGDYENRLEIQLNLAKDKHLTFGKLLSIFRFRKSNQGQFKETIHIELMVIRLFTVVEFLNDLKLIELLELLPFFEIL